MKWPRPPTASCSSLSTLRRLRSCSKAIPLPGAPARPSRLDPNDPVISPETLAQFRGMMPEAAVREIYAAVVADLDQAHADA